MQTTLSKVRTRGAPAVLSALERPVVQSLIPVVFLALVVVGTYRSFSPVPYWDMWDGAIWFYFAVRDGLDGQFMAQHNEHRIVFSKLLFWVDLHFLDARSYLLVPANVVLGVLVWLGFCWTARPLIQDDGLWKTVCCGLAVLSLSWMQHENFISAFQSQFFVAVLFPLVSFSCLAMAACGRRSWAWFLGALVFGVASLGTMVNGLFVFPLLVLMQVMLALAGGRMAWGKLLSLVVAGGAMTALWFRNYTLESAAAVPPPRDFLLFAASFMGDPLGHLTGSLGGGVMGGILVSGLALFLVLTWWRRRRLLHPMFLGLLTMIGFIAATCLVVSYGRAAIAHDAAVISRYATPSLAAWCAVVILGAALLQSSRHAPAVFARAAIAAAVVFLPIQLAAFGSQGPLLRQERMHGALSLSLDVYDPDALHKLYPSETRAYYERVKTATDRLAAMNISIFADPSWRRIVGRLGSAAPMEWPVCTGTVERDETIPNETRYRRVAGWAMDKARIDQPHLIYLAQGGRIVGIAMSGAPRPDVAKVMGWRGRQSGFNGYILSTADPNVAILCPKAADIG